MKMVIEDYGFIYPKLYYLKPILMAPSDRRKISSIADMNSLVNFAARFFPEMHLESINAKNFEKALYDVYFRIIEKILNAAPSALQSFVKTIILKYEIWNIKTVITKILAKTLNPGLPEQDDIVLLEAPEKILKNERFFEELKKSQKLEHVIAAVKKTIYGPIVEENLNKFKETGEIFYLEQSLDSFYFKYLLSVGSAFKGKVEGAVIWKYFQFLADSYNFNLVFRFVYNNISKNLLKDYFIDEGLFLTKPLRAQLMEISSPAEFFKIIQMAFAREEEIFSRYYEKLQQRPENLKNIYLQIIVDNLLRKIKSQMIFDLSSNSMIKTIEILSGKELEINLLIAQAVRIELGYEKIV